MKNFRKLAAVLAALSLASSPVSGFAVGFNGSEAEQQKHSDQIVKEALCPAESVENDDSATDLWHKPGSTGISQESEKTEEQKAPVTFSAIASSRAQHSWSEGTRGFFESQEASEAVYILDNMLTECTDPGAITDATNLNNMMSSLDIIEDCNTLRRSENLPELKITHSAMAMSQARANWSYENKTSGHAPRNKMPNGNTYPSGTKAWAEILDNYGDPRRDVTGAESLMVPRNSFDPWYYYEKAIFEGRIEGDGVTGHYEAIVEPSYEYAGAAFAMSDQPYYSVPAYSWGTCIQNFYSCFETPESFTVSEYRTLLQDYMDALPQDAELIISNIEGNLRFTGQPIVPELTVTCGQTTLTEGEDYTVSCSNNINAGTAQVTVNGKGVYAGKAVTSTFTISPMRGTMTSYTSGSLTYTGSALNLTDILHLSIGGFDLVEGVDFDVEYNDNVNAGTHTAMIALKGNFSGRYPKTFTIAPRDLVDVSLSGIQSSYPSGAVPQPVLTYNSKELVNGSDYDLTTSVSGTTGTVTIAGKGNFTGTRTASYAISGTAESLSEASITGIASSYPYTGSAIAPRPTVKMGTRTLVEGTDYTVSYSDNIHAGTGTMTVTGKGSYMGTKTAAFEIVRASITSSSVSGIRSAYPWTGAAVEPAPTVQMGSRTLAEGTDYTVSYSGNTNPGTATVTITGTGDYTGTKTVSFEIVEASAENLASAMVSGVSSSYTYTGSPIMPTPTVKMGTKTLMEGTDYSVSYSNTTNAGTAAITIRGKGSYSGTRTVTFEIVRASLSLATVSDFTNSFLYAGAPAEPEPTVKMGFRILVKGRDYTLSYSNNINAGTGTVTVTGKGNYSGSISATFSIEPLSISTAAVIGVDDSYAWTGSAIEPTVTVMWGNVLLMSGQDYQVSYVDNIDPGTAVIRITGVGNYTGTIEKSFTILDKSEPEVKAVTMHRLYNSNSGEHFYTADDNEKKFLVSVGWHDEGEGWKAPEASNTPVYRLYNENAGDHHYTLNENEKDFLVSIGWKDEGIGWYSDDARSVPLYRQYNPNARAGSHNYTPNVREHNYLISNGWNDEGIAWYGLADK